MPPDIPVQAAETFPTITASPQPSTTNPREANGVARPLDTVGYGVLV